VGAGSLNDGFAGVVSDAPLVADAEATGGDAAGAGVGAGSPVEGAALLGDAVATDGDDTAPAVSAGSFAVAEDASCIDVDPFSAADIAQPGVGAGSLSERVDVSAGDVAALVAIAGGLAAVSAEAIGMGESEAKAAAPSDCRDSKSAVGHVDLPCNTRRRAPRKKPLRPVGLIDAQDLPSALVR
jgi:hypothetical protein